MRIKSVVAHVLDAPLERAFESASMRFERRQACLVEITCDDGTIGWGECLGPARANAAIVTIYGRMLEGMNPLDTTCCWSELYNLLRDQGQRGLAVTALSGIDIALWDIKGRHLGVSVATLLGGRFRESVPAYATGGFRTDGLDRIASISADMGRYAREGFSGVKIKIGFDVEEDLRLIRAVREAIGPSVRLMIDANHGYDALEAIELGQRAAIFSIDWFEEPVVPEQLSAYQAVRAGQPIPVAGGETWQGAFAMQEALKAGAVDILQPDVCAAGGLTEALRIVALADLHGIRLVPHVFGTSIGMAAALQFLAALPPSPRRREPRPLWFEFDCTPNPLRQAMVTSPLLPDAGWMNIPDGPGLGIDIDRAGLNRFLQGASA
ncbi:mandelate racemase/muconate lactonizing enzyme family protein [Larsenimonas rhizosphaerae]|uniref:Mandelate racemase/muconate lactonizing enzyme family protein n=1 Tax=Larsenimonas rhizosphaerae TaxID=2944682 RepID=A0AA42CTA0_9GAMM|nr:mandelate racemase/muconate lactonizing enzyme family protein [Larsenimonas rhizosphaerae]MCM2130260.1 mandelate racemase/muconate lactonizing enzyme family protein [Larsenimonas rhizosphaerae]MCX2522964.1 mandelate racemase/muconate lactonizing enzyme family protein [Larsenimonas rhizosphaerae]